MTIIKTGENESRIDFDDAKGVIEFLADGGSNERECHEGYLGKAKTKRLYEAMKLYFEKDVE